MTTTTPALPKVNTIATAEENKTTHNPTMLKNFCSRIYTASGTFVRFLAILAIATILATPIPFLALKVAIGSYVPEFLLIPTMIAGIVGIPCATVAYLISFVLHKPLINVRTRDTED